MPKDLRMKCNHAILQSQHRGAHFRVREESLQEKTNNGGIADRLLRHAWAERTKERSSGLALRPGFFNRRLKLGELHFAEREEDVLFTGEIVEESSLAEIGGIGDVFDGGFLKAFAGE
ncbi:MAG TPA: hypothetical protein VL128_11425 [Candidatus Eisenbacteria bacterium]|nr:hypothetical protein [Candidatus Eisenbacteria bacterium]